MNLTPYEDTRYPIYDIDLSLPPEERWAEFACKEAKNIKRLLGDVVDMCGEHIESSPLPFRPFIRAVCYGAGTWVLGPLVNTVAGMFGEDYVAEIRSIADYSGVPLSHLMLGNLMYDLFQMGGIPGLGCSSVSCDIDGNPTLVRNMDWVWPRTTGKHSRVIRFHDGSDHYMSVSVLGCVGVLSAMCPGKWAVTINQAPTAGASPSLFQWPVLQRLRSVCDQMGSYRQLVSGLQEYKTMASFFAHVVGTKPGEHSVITGLGSDFRRRKIKGGSLVQTNHFIGHSDLEEHNNPEEWEDEDGQRWYCDSRAREKNLVEQLKRLPASLREARKKICTSVVSTDDTVQQMVFQPASGYSRVWLRR